MKSLCLVCSCMPVVFIYMYMYIIFNGPHLAYIFVVGIIDLIHLFIYLILLHDLHPIVVSDSLVLIHVYPICWLLGYLVCH